ADPYTTILDTTQNTQNNRKSRTSAPATVRISDGWERSVIRRTAVVSDGHRERNTQTKGGAELARLGMFRFRFLAEPSEEMSHLHDEDNESSH
ncbi:hypothetical protein, partial [Brevibacterium sp. HMSC08F02]|uniref:hypothetical protein n=1 Tax=Brevibacterium sp. HMSC08F02 TaxID=1581140 RepID=UPI001C407B3A